MARKKNTSKNKSNSYWMKYGGTPRKMDKGGFTHPHPHPKNATDEQKMGAQVWNTHTSGGNRLKKRSTYTWDNEKDAKNVEAFKNTRWFDYFPDTSKTIPQTAAELAKYEKAIDAHQTRNIELYNTEFDDFGDLMYGTSNLLRGTAALFPAATPQTAVGKGALWLASMLPTGIKAGWDWYKRDYNTKAKENNPNAVFTDGEGNILNYEDNEHSLFNSFAYPKGTKEVRVKPTEEEMETLNLNMNRDAKNVDPLKVEQKEMGGHGPIMPKNHPVTLPTTEQSEISKGELFERDLTGFRRDDRIGTIEEQKNAKKSITLIDREHVNKQIEEGTFWGWPGWREMFAPSFLRPKHKMGGSAGSPQEDPTFKMWFAKNARRSDVMQSSSDPEALKQLFLNDVNFNQMPVFSNEMNDFGNVDKSNRSMDLSENIIGGMKYGGMPTYQGKMPKAELGMGQGLYKHATDGHLSDYSNADARYDNFGMKMGEVADTGFMKTFNYVVPGLGTLLNLGLDYWGYKGEQKHHLDNKIDASRASDDLLSLNKKNANKETLDLSTRTDALGVKASYDGEAPDFWDDFGKDAVGDIAGMFVGGDFGKMAGMFGGGGGGADVGDAVNYDQLLDSSGSGGTMARYGGSVPKMNMGGANQFQPGLTAAMINGVVNPLSHDQQFKSQGIEQQYNAGGNVEQGPDYEAEGGEVIMHESGQVPVTTGETQQLDGEPNQAMLSMLEGNSHETMDPDGHTGEIVEGGGNQYVFSKSLKSKVWESNFAEAAERIGGHISRFKKEMENGDGITKTTAASMIEAWNQKLMDLQKEQESARQSKFMEMVQGGAAPEELNEAFPDLFKQFMAEQQQSQLSASANQMEEQAGMAANPMGDIDMSQLSAEDQQLVGAEYGLPKAENGGSDFEPYDFNQYMKYHSGFVLGDDDQTFTLDKNYMGEKSQLMDELTLNYPEGGYKVGDDTFDSPQGMYDYLSSDFSDWRNKELQRNYGIGTNKVNKADFTNEEGVLDMEAFNKAKATQRYYNSGIPMNWESNYGADAGLSRRKYFKNLETSLLADGKSKQDVASIINREKMKFDETLNLEKIAEENKPLTPEEEAAAAAQKLRNEQLGKDAKTGTKDLLNHFLTLGPTLYNRKKGKESPEVVPFIENENEAQIRQNLELLTNTDITSALKENEDNFNQLKYLAREGSDGSSGSMMNTLLRGQNFQNEADAKLFEGKTKADQLGLKIANESLFSLGENNRAEGVRVDTAQAKNRAAVQAFEAKGWEGLSGYNQLQTKMKNEMAHDKQLQGLLKHIYPDAELYINRDGGIDFDKLSESGDLDKLIEKYPELKEIIGKYIQ